MRKAGFVISGRSGVKFGIEYLDLLVAGREKGLRTIGIEAYQVRLRICKQTLREVVLICLLSTEHCLGSLATEHMKSQSFSRHYAHHLAERLLRQQCQSKTDSPGVSKTSLLPYVYEDWLG